MAVLKQYKYIILYLLLLQQSFSSAQHLYFKYKAAQFDFPNSDTSIAEVETHRYTYEKEKNELVCKRITKLHFIKGKLTDRTVLSLNDENHILVEHLDYDSLGFPKTIVKKEDGLRYTHFLNYADKRYILSVVQYLDFYLYENVDYNSDGSMNVRRTLNNKYRTEKMVIPQKKGTYTITDKLYSFGKVVRADASFYMNDRLALEIYGIDDIRMRTDYYYDAKGVLVKMEVMDADKNSRQVKVKCETDKLSNVIKKYVNESDTLNSEDVFEFTGIKYKEGLKTGAFKPDLDFVEAIIAGQKIKVNSEFVKKNRKFSSSDYIKYYTCSGGKVQDSINKFNYDQTFLEITKHTKPYFILRETNMGVVKEKYPDYRFFKAGLSKKDLYIYDTQTEVQYVYPNLDTSQMDASKWYSCIKLPYTTSRHYIIKNSEAGQFEIYLNGKQEMDYQSFKYEIRGNDLYVKYVNEEKFVLRDWKNKELDKMYALDLLYYRVED